MRLVFVLNMSSSLNKDIIIMAYTCLIFLDPRYLSLRYLGYRWCKLQNNKVINSPSATAVIMQILLWLSCD